jgi:hypothetical protein
VRNARGRSGRIRYIWRIRNRTEDSQFVIEKLFRSRGARARRYIATRQPVRLPEKPAHHWPLEELAPIEFDSGITVTEARLDDWLGAGGRLRDAA